MSACCSHWLQWCRFHRRRSNRIRAGGCTLSIISPLGFPDKCSRRIPHTWHNSPDATNSGKFGSAFARKVWQKQLTGIIDAYAHWSTLEMPVWNWGTHDMAVRCMLMWIRHVACRRRWLVFSCCLQALSKNCGLSEPSNSTLQLSSVDHWSEVATKHRDGHLSNTWWQKSSLAWALQLYPICTRGLRRTTTSEF